MILFYDTETTGLPLYKEPSADPRQPHIVQLAMLLTDHTGLEHEHHNLIIRPDGYEIPDEMAQIHGITQERAMAEGVPLVDALTIYLLLLGRAELRVAHNEAFDRRIVRIAMLRLGISRTLIESFELRPHYCTLLAATPIVNLPPTEKMLKAGFNRPKAPKLAECIKHFFNEDIDRAHDASVDVRACARLYFHLQELGKASANGN